jgi:hypothetical protein
LASLKVIELAPFSDAYFELIRRLPAVKPYFALGDQVIIVGDGMALRLTPDGATTWKSGELKSVLRALEGSL